MQYAGTMFNKMTFLYTSYLASLKRRIRCSYVPPLQVYLRYVGLQSHQNVC